MNNGMMDTSYNDIFVLALVLFLIYWVYLITRRISSLSDLSSNVSGRWLSGRVAVVGDGDGFKFFHVPLFRSSFYKREDLKLTIRLAGIDAPETGQPFFSEAKETLKNLILNRSVKIKLLDVDRYNRLLATCYRKSLFSTINVNKKMVELGMACVYRGSGAIYDDYEEELLKLEQRARKNKIGIWSQKNYVSPMEYKKRLGEKKNNNMCIIL